MPQRSSRRTSAAVLLSGVGGKLPFAAKSAKLAPAQERWEVTLPRVPVDYALQWFAPARLEIGSFGMGNGD
jgi:hypothetical protein